MPSGKEILDRMFLEMRWRALSLAADLDRIERGDDGAKALADPRIEKLRKALQVAIEAKGNRAEQVQMIFSDLSPPPIDLNPKSEIRNPK